MSFRDGELSPAKSSQHVIRFHYRFTIYFNTRTALRSVRRVAMAAQYRRLSHSKEWLQLNVGVATTLVILCELSPTNSTSVAVLVVKMFEPPKLARVLTDRDVQKDCQEVELAAFPKRLIRLFNPL